MAKNFKKSYRSDDDPWRLSALTQGVKAVSSVVESDEVVRSITADSRKVVPGTLYFAVKGLRSDGNKFVDEAIEKGAVGVVSEVKKSKHLPVDYVQVTDVRVAMGQIAAAFYGSPNRKLRVVGVTGTNGKTTVTMLVQYFLKRLGAKAGLSGTIHYDYGNRTIPAARTTPDSIELYGALHNMVECGCEYAVMEVSSHALDQKRVYDLNTEVAVFTNLTEEHLDYHSTMDGYFEAKCAYFDGRNGAVPRKAVINTDDAYGRKLLERIPSSVEVCTFGLTSDAKLRACNIVMDAKSSRFDIMLGEKTHKGVEMGLPGRYNVYNLLASLGVIHELGFSIEVCLSELKNFPGVPGRMERITQRENGFHVFVDYAHTPDALKNALGMLRGITPKNLYVVFGCGGNRDRLKRPLMMDAVQQFADYVWATSDNPRNEKVEDIFKDMKTGVSDFEKIAFIADRRMSIGSAVGKLEVGDTLLIAGKGHETYQEFADTIAPFDDRFVAREMLQIKKSKMMSELLMR
jgi:UDP-N-acetylmuramoyl-L-alanyl-D-glutamate--2,6-diaminopimelate ligase